MDLWGRIYLDHWRDDPHPHAFVRDDGERNVVESAATYFEAPRWPAEGAACQTLHGRVLDLGCGPGSYTLFLEGRGLDVVAIDSSPGAIQVCVERGCRDPRVMDLRELRLEPRSFDALICMGNTLGINQSPKTLSPFLADLRRLLKPGGRLVVSGVDPLATTVPNRIRYHQQNRARGLPPALVRARLEYRGDLSDFWTLWIPTADELERAAVDAGWRIDSIVEDDSARLWVLTRTAS